MLVLASTTPKRYGTFRAPVVKLPITTTFTNGQDWSLVNLSEMLKIESGGDALLKCHLWCLNDHKGEGTEDADS